MKEEQGKASHEEEVKYTNEDMCVLFARSQIGYMFCAFWFGTSNAMS